MAFGFALCFARKSFFDIWPMPIKRVLHLSSESTWRGGEQQMAYLIEESIIAGLEISVAGKRGSEFQKWCADRGVPFHPMGFKNGLDISTSNRIKKLARNQNIDLIHTHSGKSQSLAYWASRLGMPQPVVVHRRVDFPLKSKGFSLRKYTYPGVKAIICVSKTIEEMVREKTGTEKFVSTVYSGIDFSRFNAEPSTGYLHREFGISPEKKLVANISALADHKDYPTFIRAAKAFSEKSDEVHFLIVGEGELRSELEKLVSASGIQNHLTFTGFREDVPKIFRELTAFLITSKTEGLGTTVIDAMHNGLPILATRGGGIPELVVDGETGFLCEVGDYQCLAEKLLYLIEHPDQAAVFGKNARERSLLFSKEAMAKEVIKIYEKVLA